MPRIAVAVGVVALMAFSIGFNTARYAVVWDMVGGSSRPSDSSQPTASAAVAQPTAAVEDNAAHRTAGTEKEQTACEALQTLAARQPQRSGPSAQDSAGVGAAEPTVPSASAPQLARAETMDARQNAAAGMDSGCKVRRLPPIDRIAPCPATNLQSVPGRLVHSPGEPIPVYPSTGT